MFYQWEPSKVGAGECQTATYEQWEAFLCDTYSSLYVNKCYAIILTDLSTGYKQRCLYETKDMAIGDFDDFVNGRPCKLRR